MPLVFNQHYTGTMDHWDPAVTDGFAKSREVILFNNAGVSSSSGEVPPRSPRWAPMLSLSSKRSDWRKSTCSAFRSAALSRRKSPLRPPILFAAWCWWGPAPRGGEGMEGGTPEGNRIFGASYDPPDDLWLSVFFTPSAASQAAGREFLKRFRLRSKTAIPK